MLKTISAALLAMSVIAAPALAAETGKTATPAPVTKTAPATKPAPVIKSEQLPSKVQNANAKMGHHSKHYRHHHRHHKHMGMLKVKAPKHATRHVHGKVAIKHVAPAKRG
ncbi:His-rich protein BRANT [Bradyrhizobium semiaridum]|uniref:His-rich protein BRANT n=1 Tax=Bradyrhizobium semiaridum TaxID=2821404 RepID=UPI001CE2C455|nr:hypothetical protein [Bradyrhizobium semiaridum]